MRFSLWTFLFLSLAAAVPATAQQSVTVGASEIGGVVPGSSGPEAGVWVIAETTDLPTRYIKSVVTDDQGRYLIPALPVASYQVWVRGYGLVDSPKMRGKPGQILNHTAVSAPNERAAAHLYGAFFVKPLRSGSSFFFVSFFVRSEPVSSPRPTNPRRCRAQGLSRLAVAPTLPRAPIIARPHLDSSEHGSTLVVVGMTINEGSAPFAAG